MGFIWIWQRQWQGQASFCIGFLVYFECFDFQKLGLQRVDVLSKYFFKKVEMIQCQVGLRVWVGQGLFLRCIVFFEIMGKRVLLLSYILSKGDGLEQVD